jgi:hypothetical protein
LFVRFSTPAEADPVSARRSASACSKGPFGWDIAPRSYFLPAAAAGGRGRLIGMNQIETFCGSLNANAGGGGAVESSAARRDSEAVD